MKIYSIESLQDDFAICEDDNCKCINIKISELPALAKEGDMIIIDDNGNITIDKELTKARREQIKKLEDSLFEENN